MSTTKMTDAEVEDRYAEFERWADKIGRLDDNYSDAIHNLEVLWNRLTRLEASPIPEVREMAVQKQDGMYAMLERMKEKLNEVHDDSDRYGKELKKFEDQL